MVRQGGCNYFYTYITLTVGGGHWCLYHHIQGVGIEMWLYSYISGRGNFRSPWGISSRAWLDALAVDTMQINDFYQLLHWWCLLPCRFKTTAGSVVLPRSIKHISKIVPTFHLPANNRVGGRLPTTECLFWSGVLTCLDLGYCTGRIDAKHPQASIYGILKGRWQSKAVWYKYRCLLLDSGHNILNATVCWMYSNWLVVVKDRSVFSCRRNVCGLIVRICP